MVLDDLALVFIGIALAVRLTAPALMREFRARGTDRGPAPSRPAD